MYDEDDLLPISAIQHLSFCERQCALIHIEAAWAENVLTAQGRALHEKAHSEDATENRGDMRIARGLRLRSLNLGLSGVADVVEFHKILGTQKQGDVGTPDTFPAGIPLAGVEGLWRPFPVEYKRGKPKIDRCDEAQVCAQALCIEEMLHVHIPEGAIYYGTPHKRQGVIFDEELRAETLTLAARLHELIDIGVTPPPKYEKKCKSCSLIDICMPRATSSGRSAAARNAEFIAGIIDENGSIAG